MEFSKEKFVIEFAKLNHRTHVRIKTKVHEDSAGKGCHVFYILIYRGKEFSLDMGWRRYDHDETEFYMVDKIENQNFLDRFKDYLIIKGKNGKYLIKKRKKMKIPESLNPKQVSALLNFFKIKKAGDLMYEIAREETGNDNVKSKKHNYKTSNIINSLKKRKINEGFAYTGISALNS